MKNGLPLEFISKPNRVCRLETLTPGTTPRPVSSLRPLVSSVRQGMRHLLLGPFVWPRETSFTYRCRRWLQNTGMSSFAIQTGGFSRFEVITAAAAIWLGLGFVCLFIEGERIATQVHGQVLAAIKTDQLLWHAVEVDGRHVVLHGAVESAANSAAVLEHVRKVSAVSALEPRLIQLPAAALCQQRLDVFSANAPVEFKAGTADLDEAAFESLARMAGVIRQCSHRVEVGVHTTLKGDAEINLRLAERRADVIARYLVRLGVLPEQLAGVGYGERQPLSMGGSPSNSNERVSNERVTYRVAGGAA